MYIHAHVHNVLVTLHVHQSSSSPPPPPSLAWRQADCVRDCLLLAKLPGNNERPLRPLWEAWVHVQRERLKITAPVSGDTLITWGLLSSLCLLFFSLSLLNFIFIFCVCDLPCSFSLAYLFPFLSLRFFFFRVKSRLRFISTVFILSFVS